MTGTSLRIERANLDSSAAQGLIDALNAETAARYQTDLGGRFRLDPEEVQWGHGAFLIAYERDAPVGCGAVRILNDVDAELKRMYVVPSARGKGYGKSILQSLEQQAVRLGAERLLLETGMRQPEAIAVYERAGFERIENYGEYAGSAISICMAKSLVVPRSGRA